MQIDYDLAGRVDEIRHLGPGGTSLAVLDYLLDPTGAVDQIDDLAGAPVGNVLDYGYDLTKQLVSVVYRFTHLSGGWLLLLVLPSFSCRGRTRLKSTPQVNHRTLELGFGSHEFFAHKGRPAV